METDRRSKIRSEQLRDVSLSTEDRINGDRNIATVEEWMSERVSPETNPVRKTVKNEKTVEGGDTVGEDKLTPETKPAKKNTIEEKNEDEIHKTRNIEETPEREEAHEKLSEERVTPEKFTASIVGVETIREEHAVAGTVGALDTDTKAVGERRDDGPNSKTQTNDESTKQTAVEEERESKLVAGISLYRESRGDGEDEKTSTGRKKNVEKEDMKNEEFVERVNEDHIAIGTLKPPLRKTSSKVWKESDISATIQIIPVSPYQHNAHPQPPTPPTPHAKVSPQSFPPFVTVSPTVMYPVSLIEDHLIEVLQSPGLHIKQNELVLKVSPDLEDVTVRNLLLKPAQKELQTAHKEQEIHSISQSSERKLTPKVQKSTPKPKDDKFVAKDFKSKKPSPAPTSKEHKLSAKLLKLTHKPNMTQQSVNHKTVQLMKSGKLTKPPRTTSNTQNKRSKNKVVKSKEKKRRKDVKTQKPSEKNEVTTAKHFPYFMDNYCPPECACYGR